MTPVGDIGRERQPRTGGGCFQGTPAVYAGPGPWPYSGTRTKIVMDQVKPPLIALQLPPPPNQTMRTKTVIAMPPVLALQLPLPPWATSRGCVVVMARQNLKPDPSTYPVYGPLQRYKLRRRMIPCRRACSLLAFRIMFIFDLDPSRSLKIYLHAKLVKKVVCIYLHQYPEPI